MHSVCRCSLQVWRRSFLKKGTPWPILPRPGFAPGRIWLNNNNTCKGPWLLHTYQVSSKPIKRIWRRSRKYEKFTDGRTDGQTYGQTDGRTDDGRCAMTIAHSRFRLRWAKIFQIVLSVLFRFFSVFGLCSAFWIFQCFLDLFNAFWIFLSV